MLKVLPVFISGNGKGKCSVAFAKWLTATGTQCHMGSHKIIASQR